MIALLLLAAAADDAEAWRTRYEAVLETPDIEALSRIEPLVNEYFDAEERRRGEIAAALSREPRDLVEAAVRRGRRYPEAAVGGVTTQRVHVQPGDYDVEYEAFVPERYDPNRPTAALITLHGQGGRGADMMRIWRARAESRGDLIVLAPTADRYGWGMSRAGFAAVLGTREDAMRRWNIDASRVYLDGMSMGANGGFDLAMHRPGLFAAFAPRSGGPMPWRTEDPRTHEITTEMRFAENLCATPVYWVLGARDSNVPLEDMHAARDRMESFGVPLTYREHADGGHEWYPEEDEEVLLWMVQQQLALCPDRVVLTADEVDFSRPVQARVNGRSASSRRAEPSVAFLLEEARRTGDRERVFWAAVDVRAGR